MGLKALTRHDSAELDGGGQGFISIATVTLLMNDGVRYVWTNSLRSIKLLVKWFIAALVARLAMGLAIIAVSGPSVFVYLFLDELRAPVAVSLSLALLTLLGGLTAFGAVSRGFPKILAVDSPE